jgi:acyl-CoA thioester hydrolase
MELRVYYEDTDCGNVVYYANYLKYMERSRTELLRDRGIDLAEYHAKGFLFAVTEANIKYKAPARYNDLLEVSSIIVELTPVTILFSTLISRVADGLLLVSGDVRVACIRVDGKLQRMPKEIKDVLGGLVQG